MAIRKKDGNVYVLEGPNPVVKDQVAWDPEALVFHNFHWEEFLFSKVAKNRPKPPPKEEAPKVEAPKMELPPEPKEEIPDQNSEKPGSEPSRREFDLPYIRYKVLCYCLPATTKVHVDRLYGESWQKTTYGNKFVFPCVVMDSTDMGLEFWTSDPDGRVREHSVVYPFSYEVHNASADSYDRVPYDEYRWWKVSEREAKEGGWLVRCVPSESHPDFSD